MKGHIKNAFVWCIYTTSGKIGYVIWQGEREFIFQLPPNIGLLIKQEVDKTNSIPLDFLEIVLLDFFSVYIKKISNGVCWAELLPTTEYDSFADLPKRPSVNYESNNVSQSDKFLYLRKFNSKFQYTAVIADSLKPGQIITAAPIGLHPVTNLFNYV